jgi:hypothetical protein
MKISKRWFEMAEMYRRFAGDYEHAYFGENSAIEMYRYETFGDPINSKWNGFAIGKKWMDVTLAMWREDIAKGMLFISELQADYPEWFLRRVGILK